MVHRKQEGRPVPSESASARFAAMGHCQAGVTTPCKVSQHQTQTAGDALDSMIPLCTTLCVVTSS
jgi:hypothetical protein